MKNQNAVTHAKSTESEFLSHLLKIKRIRVRFLKQGSQYENEVPSALISISFNPYKNNLK
jgi:hypothetical protein